MICDMPEYALMWPLVKYSLLQSIWLKSLHNSLSTDTAGLQQICEWASSTHTHTHTHTNLSNSVQLW